MAPQVKIISNYGSDPKHVLKELEDNLNKTLKELSEKAVSMEIHVTPITIRNQYGMVAIIVYEEQ